MKTRVALITGGFTQEAEVSLKSADFVQSNLCDKKYEVYPIFININKWYYLDADGVEYEIDKNDFSISLPKFGKIKFDVAFIILHGIPGEDGRIQGYLDMLRIPYTSCGALSSAITMNKSYTKSVLKDIKNLYLAKWVHLFEYHQARAYDIITTHLALPYFVKPNAGGSSIGMSKVTQDSELQRAIDLAFTAENTGAEVIIEEFIYGREFSQGIYTNLQGEIVVLPASEVITSRDFFDYEAKYISGLTEEITPADLSDDQCTRIEAILKEIYVQLNCKGMVRVDYFLEKETDRFYFVEINTIPGQTKQSFIPQQVRAMGLTESDFYDELIQVALKGNQTNI